MSKKLKKQNIMKTTITKTELKRIHDIACETWRNKIVEYTERNPFGDTIDFSEKEIQEMVSASTVKQLPIVKEIFNIINNWESIKTVEDAIKILGEKDEEVSLLKDMQRVSLPRHIIAEQELVVIIKAVNSGWEADFDNNQYKYFPWWYLGKSFSLSRVFFCLSSGIPRRLCLETREKAEYMSEQFKNLYEQYLNK